MYIYYINNRIASISNTTVAFVWKFVVKQCPIPSKFTKTLHHEIKKIMLSLNTGSNGAEILRNHGTLAEMKKVQHLLKLI